MDNDSSGDIGEHKTKAAKPKNEDIISKFIKQLEPRFNQLDNLQPILNELVALRKHMAEQSRYCNAIIDEQSPQELQLMVEELRNASNEVGLEINLSETKVMFNRNVEIQPIMTGNVSMDQVDRYTYLGQLISIHRDWEPEAELKPMGTMSCPRYKPTYYVTKKKQVLPQKSFIVPKKCFNSSSKPKKLSNTFSNNDNFDKRGIKFGKTVGLFNEEKQKNLNSSFIPPPHHILKRRNIKGFDSLNSTVEAINTILNLDEAEEDSGVGVDVSGASTSEESFHSSARSVNLELLKMLHSSNFTSKFARSQSLKKVRKTNNFTNRKLTNSLSFDRALNQELYQPELTILFLGTSINQIQKKLRRPSRKNLLKHQITVKQQLTEGPAISIFKGSCYAGEEFTFSSRRSKGRPFSIVIFVDDVIDLKVNTCCEYRHRIGNRLGGSKGHFQLRNIRYGKECYQCLLRAEDKKKSSSNVRHKNSASNLQSDVGDCDQESSKEKRNKNTMIGSNLNLGDNSKKNTTKKSKASVTSQNLSQENLQTKNPENICEQNEDFSKQDSEHASDESSLSESRPETFSDEQNDTSCSESEDEDSGDEDRHSTRNRCSSITFPKGSGA
ncbi:Glutamate-rich protein 3 [Nymphon striatum]|nr:Glutamate-rich protein 3 [Nymphon striatum]